MTWKSEYEKFSPEWDLEAYIHWDSYTWLLDFSSRRMPNMWEWQEYYEKQHKPYTMSTLPNLRFVDGCWNCKNGDSMDCGSHTENDCGICRDYIGESKICDLWEDLTELLKVKP